MNPDTYQVWPSLTGFLVLQRELAFAHNFSENTNISIGQGFHKKPWEHYDVANRLHLPQKQILLRWLTKEAGDYKVSMSMDEMWNLTLNQSCLIDWVRKSYTWIWFLMHSSDYGSRNNHLYNVLIVSKFFIFCCGSTPACTLFILVGNISRQVSIMLHFLSVQLSV